MSGNYYNTFYEEVQTKFSINTIEIIPTGVIGGCVIIKLTPNRIHKICPHCGNGKTYIHEYKHRNIHGGEYNGMPIIYQLDQPRYECPKCESTFVEEYDCLPWEHGIAVEAEEYIIASLGTMTMTQIAQNLQLSEQTVANRAMVYAAEQKKIMLEGKYRYLSMDEVFIGRDKNGAHRIFWVLNDNSTPWKSNNIEIGLGRSANEVADRLRALKFGEKVEAVSIDMWEAYRDAIHMALPNAEVVVDRFHVEKNAHETMNLIRRNANAPEAVKKKMKKDAALFLKPMAKLLDDELDRLSAYLDYDPRLKKVYYLIQDFMDFYNTRDYDQALEHLCRWESAVIESGYREYIGIYDTVCNWLPYIMNYFRFRITNGRTEGKNNLLRVIDRMGFHYGLNCLQGCLYAHDRKQELIKWRNHQHKIEKKLKLKNTVSDKNKSSECNSNIAA